MTIQKATTLIWSLPPKLREEVKAFGMACMDAQQSAGFGGDNLEIREQFRALCAPEEVKP